MKSHLNTNNIIEMLASELKFENSIIPIISNIPKGLSNGIYFWFMESKGYEILSTKINVIPLESRYSIEIDGLNYDLVYLGTAGTGKQMKSNLSARLNWHIGQNHSENEIFSKYLSTLRKGIGSLLADDLIKDNTKDLVNGFLEMYLRVFWIEYPDNKTQINNDEIAFIKVLKPLFNLKNNPNALKSAKENSTKFFKARLNYVQSNTIKRLVESGIKVKKKNASNLQVQSQPLKEEIIEKSCVEYFVLQNQNIADITKTTNGLHKGQSKIKIFDSSNPNLEFTQWRRITGNDNNLNSQNIYTYFDKISSDGRYRHIVISEWMKKYNINQIRVIVCPLN